MANTRLYCRVAQEQNWNRKAQLSEPYFFREGQNRFPARANGTGQLLEAYLRVTPGQKYREKPLPGSCPKPKARNHANRS